MRIMIKCNAHWCLNNKNNTCILNKITLNYMEHEGFWCESNKQDKKKIQKQSTYEQMENIRARKRILGR